MKVFSTWLALFPTLLRLAALLLLSTTAANAVKLKIPKVECVTETIQYPGSLVTVAVVASAFRGAESYFDLQVLDPSGDQVYYKEEIETAEISFSTRLAGPHKFCFTVSKKNTNLGSGIGSPRVGKKIREVSFDIMVGETWSHDRVKTEHLDALMEDISSLKIRVQKLKSEVRYLKFREIRHRKTVKSTARRVTRYSLGKMIVIIIIAIAQPAIIAIFFQRQFKY